MEKKMHYLVQDHDRNIVAALVCAGGHAEQGASLEFARLASSSSAPTVLVESLLQARFQRSGDRMFALVPPARAVQAELTMTARPIDGMSAWYVEVGPAPVLARCGYCGSRRHPAGSPVAGCPNCAFGF